MAQGPEQRRGTASQVRPVILRDGDTDLVGQLVVPEGIGPHPAVLVMPSAMGMGDHYLEIAHRLARLGFTALLADMYGGGTAFARPEDAGGAHGALIGDSALLVRRSVAWFEALCRQDESDPARVGAIGYCFGGKCVLEIARSGADAKAVVSFHGTLTTDRPAAPGAIKALIAIYTGRCDPFAPLADVAAFETEMQAAEARWHLTSFSHACHSFTTVADGALPIAGLAYDPLADAVSWAGAVALLKQVLGGTADDVRPSAKRRGE